MATLQITDLTRKVYLKIGKANVPKELQDLFIQAVSGKSNVSKELEEEIIIKQFVDSFIEVLACANEPDAFRGITVFFNLIKNDMKIFDTFKPIRSIIRRMKLERFMMQEEKIREPIFDFIIFMLRYYQHLDYDDITDSVALISKIKREEMGRSWIEIEDMLTKFEKLELHFAETREVSTKSFEELYAYLDRIAKDQNAIIENLDQRMHNLEERMDNFKETFVDLLYSHDSKLRDLPNQYAELLKQADQKIIEGCKKPNKEIELINSKLRELEELMHQVKEQNFDIGQQITGFQDKLSDQKLEHEKGNSEYIKNLESQLGLTNRVLTGNINTVNDLLIEKAQILEEKIRNFSIEARRNLDTNKKVIDQQFEQLNLEMKNSFDQSNIEFNKSMGYLNDRLQKEEDNCHLLNNNQSEALQKTKEGIESLIQNLNDLLKKTEKDLADAHNNLKNTTNNEITELNQKIGTMSDRFSQDLLLEKENCLKKYKNMDENVNQKVEMLQNKINNNKDDIQKLKQEDIALVNLGDRVQNLESNAHALQPLMDKVLYVIGGEDGSLNQPIGKSQKTNLTNSESADAKKNSNAELEKNHSSIPNQSSINEENNKQSIGNTVPEKKNDPVTNNNNQESPSNDPQDGNNTSNPTHGAHEENKQSDLPINSEKNLNGNSSAQNLNTSQNTQKLSENNQQANPHIKPTINNNSDPQNGPKHENISQDPANSEVGGYGSERTKGLAGRVKLLEDQNNFMNDLKAKLNEFMKMNEGEKHPATRQELSNLKKDTQDKIEALKSLLNEASNQSKADDDKIKNILDQVDQNQNKKLSTLEEELKKQLASLKEQQENHASKASADIPKVQDELKLLTEKYAKQVDTEIPKIIEQLKLFEPKNELENDVINLMTKGKALKPALLRLFDDNFGTENQKQKIIQVAQSLEDKFPTEGQREKIIEIVKNYLKEFPVANQEKTSNNKQENFISEDLFPTEGQRQKIVQICTKIMDEKFPSGSQKDKILLLIKDQLKLNNENNNPKIDENSILKKVQDMINAKLTENGSTQNPKKSGANETPVNKNELELKIHEIIGPLLDDMEKVFTSENDKLWDFLQEFVNEQACSRIKSLKSADFSTREKMDAMDWIARNIEFISPSLLDQACDIVRTTIQSKDQNIAIALNKQIFLEKHNSDIMFSMVTLMKESEDSHSDALFNLISGYLKILDVLILSDFNLEKGVISGLLPVLVSNITDNRFSEEDQDKSFKIIGSCMRSPNIMSHIQAKDSLFNKAVENFKKENISLDVLTASIQIFKEFLLIPNYREKIFSLYPKYEVMITKILQIHHENDELICACIQNFQNIYYINEELEKIQEMNLIAEIVECYKTSDKASGSHSEAQKFLKSCSAVKKIKDYLISIGFSDF